METRSIAMCHGEMEFWSVTAAELLQQLYMPGLRIARQVRVSA
jgi:hypothetical protein